MESLKKATNDDEMKFDCQLSPITEIADLIQLRDLYCKDWPRHCVGYYCLDNFIRWLRISPNIQNLKIFTLNGVCKSDGLCLIVDRYQLFVNSLNTVDFTNLRKAMSLLDWSIGYKVSSLQQFLYPAVMSVVEAKRLKLEYNSLTVMFHMPKGQAKKLEVNCSEGFVLSPLKKEDAKCIDDLWPNKHVGSLFLIQRLIEWNANAGIYKKDTGELAAWCLRLQGGFLGALQVKAEYKRLGLGLQVAAATSKLIGEMGHDVIALVNETNIPSLSLFKKLGFEIIDKCYWIRSYPTIEGYAWPDNV